MSVAVATVEGPTRRVPLFNLVAHTLLSIWTAIIVIPLLWILVSSFKPTKAILGNPLGLPVSLNTVNYINAWVTSGIGGYFLNTVIVVGVSLVFVMVLGAMCAYVLARFRFHGSRAIYLLMLAGLTFPIFLAIVPLFQTLKSIGLLNSLPGLIVTYIAFALPFTVFFLYSFFRGFPPELYEAAQLDGAGEWRTFFKVVLPTARPGIAAVSLFNFLGLWNQFLLPISLNTNPKNYVLTQGMANYQAQAGYAVDFGGLFAGVVITIIPVLVVYLFFQRRLQDSVTEGAVK